MADANPQGAQQGAQQQLQVKVPDDVQKGTYSNAVSVNVNSNEVVLDFGYLLPNTPNPIIEVVSRVNMNQRTAESFIGVLSGAMEDFKKKQAQMNTTASAGASPSAPSPVGTEPAAGAAVPVMPPYPENA